MAGSNTSWAGRAGLAVAAAASFLIVWTTVVRDDGSGMDYFLVILAAGVGGFAAGFRPAGLARALLGVAVMQALLGVATATAPVVAGTPHGSLVALLYNGFFAVLWLVSALCFRFAATRQQRAATAY